MISKVNGATIVGIDASIVEVEIDMQHGLSKFIIVGLPDKAVEESSERVKSAMMQSGVGFPSCRIICNLAPGDIKKEGPILDLPIAVGMLIATRKIDPSIAENSLFVGELSLNGTLRPIDGALSIAILCEKLGIKRLFLPKANAEEVIYLPNIEVYGMDKLIDVHRHLEDMRVPKASLASWQKNIHSIHFEIDYEDVKGQDHAIRALEIAAAGAHNVLMVGPPGSGKSMLASRIPTILPPLSLEESLEVTRIYSASGKYKNKRGLMRYRPFRAPHHTTSYAALVGGSGGKGIKAGEITLAHMGVLFLDEMPEFGRLELEALRQPLETGKISIARARAAVDLPAECMLIGAMNPCPCGYKGYPEEKCVSNYQKCGKYVKKISGPLLDRIDLNIQVSRVSVADLSKRTGGRNSAEIRENVLRAREIQTNRFGCYKTNSALSPKQIKEHIVLDNDTRDILNKFAERQHFTARSYDRVLRVTRTIADLDNSNAIKSEHLMEALQYRISEV